MSFGWRGTGPVRDYTFIINCHGKRDACRRHLFFDKAFDLVLIIAEGFGTQVSIFTLYLSTNTIKEED